MVTTDVDQPDRVVSGVASYVDVLRKRVTQILHRRPSVGLAVGVVRDGSFSFNGQGLADIETATGITEETVFRIGSITKTLTGVAVMQLGEEGLVAMGPPD